MEKIKRIALVAHDNRKRDLKEWVEFNYRTLVRHNLVCYGDDGPARRGNDSAQISIRTGSRTRS